MSDDEIVRIFYPMNTCSDNERLIAVAIGRAVYRKALEEAAARIATLEQTLREIANADTVEWGDPTEFEAWAKSRARRTLERGGKA
jgi:hypothetical protein